MKKLLVLVALAALSFGAMAEEAKKAKAPAKAAAGKAVLWSADELKWVDPPNSPPGIKMAVAWGDPEKGPHGAFHKIPAGFSAPLHYHNADHHAVVISGTLVMTPEGGTEKKLGPGSWFTYTGKKKHTTACEAGADCLIYGEAKGKWDVVMPEAKK